MPIDVRDLTPTQTPLAKARPYVCSICGSSFSNQAGLTAHMARVHGEAVSPPSLAKPQTQAELWRATPPPSPQKTPPTDIPLWQKGLEYLLYPFTEFGMQRRELGIPWWMPTTKPLPAEYYRPEAARERWIGGREYEEYQALPFMEQLKWEAPAWAMTTLIPGAIQARAALAPVAARGGAAAIAPKVARGALLPAELAERGLGVALKYGVGLPLKYGVAKPLVAGARKSLELALDTGLDKWLIRQGIRGDQANSVIRFFLEKNQRWLYQRAEANWLKRLAEKKSMAETATRAASDTIIEAEPLLLRAVKDVGIKAPAVAKPIPELPVGVTPKPTIPIKIPTPTGVTYMAAEAPISVAQTTQITQLATGKALISELGKVKPQLRQLIKVFTGKTKIGDLAQAEADNIIEALEKLPDATYRAGRLTPPSIPTSTRVVPENFFNLEFKKPTPIKYFTSQNYYSQQLGVKPLVEPLELAKQRMDLERMALDRTIDSKGVAIDKVFRTTLAEKVAAKAKNVPTPAIAKMRDLLNKYEDAPEFLSLEEAKLFGWFRNLNRTMLNGENEVRRLLGMPEIPYRQAYVRHIADGLAYEILAGKYPLPEGLKYWSSQIVGKKIFNPMEMARKLAVDLEEYFTKDLMYATKSMVHTALKEIHLSQPLRAFTEQLSAVSKDLPIYKHLSAEELSALRKIEVMPATTKKWVIDYVNQVIKGQPTGLDEAVNRMLINRGLAAVINKFLSPFGRSLGMMPITKMATFEGRMVISGAMGSPIGGRPKQIIRNKFQGTQNLALYTIKANIRGNLLLLGNSPEELVLRELLAESLFMKGYTGIEELPVGTVAKLEKWGLAGYQWSAISNARTAEKVAFWDTLELITKPKYKGYGWADPQRTYTEAKGFLYPSERAKLLKEMEFGAGCTQYQYIGMGMPEVFRSKVLIPVTRLQSWWMNYFFKFHREAATRAFTGKTSYGAELPWSRRLGWFRYLILGGAILIPMGYSASYLFGVLPSRFAPAFQIAVGLYQYATADTEWEKTRAMKQMFNAWQVLVPYGLAFKEFQAVFTGERPIESLFFYSTEESIWYKPEWAEEEKGAIPEPRFPGGPKLPMPEFPTPRFPQIMAPTAGEFKQQIEDATWGQYPPSLKKIADQIKELEKTDPVAARKLQFQYPQILAIRRQIALQQGQLKRQEAMRERQELLQGR